MEIFKDYKNKYFQCLQRVINDIYYYGAEYNDKDIKKIFRNNTFNEYDDIERLILDGEQIKLLKKNDRDYYELTIKVGLPVRGSYIEYQWLKNMLNDPMGRLLLDGNTINKLEESLKSIEAMDICDHWKKTNIDNMGDDYILIKEHLMLIEKAIINEKWIKYTSTDNKGALYEDQVGFPYKIEYSCKNNKFRLSLLPEGWKRVIKINVSGIRSIDIINDYKDNPGSQIAAFISGKKKLQHPLVLEIKDKYNNALERCFYLFLDYEKEASYNAKKKIHIMKIYYYDFDKKEIINNIISLGSSVTVLEPDDIRDEVIRKLIKMRDMYDD